MQLEYSNTCRHRSDFKQLINNSNVANSRICVLYWMCCGIDKSRQCTFLCSVFQLKRIYLQRTQNAKHHQLRYLHPNCC